MNKTVADLMGESKENRRSSVEWNSGSPPESGQAVETGEPRLRELYLILEPSQCEIIDGLVVITKRLITHSRDEALVKFGVRFK